MATPFRAHAVTFLAGSLVLLLAAGLYQRVANPALHLHVDARPPAAQADQADHDHPPLTPEDTAKLGQAMGRLREKPGDVETMLEIAAIFSRNRDWINAVSFLERAAQAAPKDMRPLFFLGMALASQGRHAEAAAAFEETLTMAPGNAEARFNLGILYRYYLHQDGKAGDLFRAVAESPEAGEDLRELARKELAR